MQITNPYKISTENIFFISLSNRKIILPLVGKQSMMSSVQIFFLERTSSVFSDYNRWQKNQKLEFFSKFLSGVLVLFHSFTAKHTYYSSAMIYAKKVIFWHIFWKLKMKKVRKRNEGQSTVGKNIWLLEISLLFYFKN